MLGCMMTGVSKAMTAAAVAMASCVMLSACGASDDGADDSPPTSASPSAAESSSTTSTPSAEAATMTMKDACPEVEAVLQRGFIAGFGKMSTYVDRLNELSDAGDTETKNALDLLIPNATALMLVVARNGKGGELSDALGDHLDGLSAFADRCEAAGSSALQ
mgnify:CR=1 FL=1